MTQRLIVVTHGTYMMYTVDHIPFGYNPGIAMLNEKALMVNQK